MYHKLIQNTEKLTKILNERKHLLEQLISSKQTVKESELQGYLKILVKENFTEYYHVIDNKRTYLHKSEIEFAKQLAQKSYDEKIMINAETELKKIRKLKPVDYQSIYDTLVKPRQALINPITPSDEEYIKTWSAVKYQPLHTNNLTSEFYTKKGERVRSKSELMIADALERRGIPYRYEYPIYLNDIGTVHPDFYCLNTRIREEICWEHFGMMDNPEYAQNAIQKINSYIKNNINLIYSFETTTIPLSSKTIENIIDNNLI